MHSKWIVCFLAVFLTGCSVTHYSDRMDTNPLESVAEQAAGQFTVTWEDDSTLRLKDVWLWHSIFSFGITTFHADLRYASGELEGDFYLQCNQVGALFLPVRIHAGSGFFGAILKPGIRAQMKQVLRYAGTSPGAGTLEHNVKRSVIQD